MLTGAWKSLNRVYDWSGGKHETSSDQLQPRPDSEDLMDGGGAVTMAEEMGGRWRHEQQQRKTVTGVPRTNGPGGFLREGRFRTMDTLNAPQPSTNKDARRVIPQSRSHNLAQRKTTHENEEPPTKRPKHDANQMPWDKYGIRPHAASIAASDSGLNAKSRIRTPSLPQSQSQIDLSQSIVGSPELNQLSSKIGKKRRRQHSSMTNGSALSVTSESLIDRDRDSKDYLATVTDQKSPDSDSANNKSVRRSSSQTPKRTARQFLEDRNRLHSSTARSPGAGASIGLRPSQRDPVERASTPQDMIKERSTRQKIDLTKGFNLIGDNPMRQSDRATGQAGSTQKNSQPTSRAIGMLDNSINLVTPKSSLASRASARRARTELGSDVRYNFVADGDRPRKRARAEERMKSNYWPDSKCQGQSEVQSHARDGDADSADELAAGPTISSVQNSPTKPRRTVQQPGDASIELNERSLRNSTKSSPERSLRRSIRNPPETPNRALPSASAEKRSQLTARGSSERSTNVTRRVSIEESPRSTIRDSFSNAANSTPRETRATRGTAKQVDKVPARTPTPPERWSRMNKIEWSRPVLYPVNGTRRATVDAHDLERLDEGEFLNDSVIGYALRRIEETMEHRDKVYFFNSFFYSTLTKSGSRAFNYDAVKKWTKGKDLLSIPFIVVPINHELHWFTAIICNLPRLRADEPAPVDKMEGLTLADSSSPQDTSTRSRKFDTNKPSIIILDSLGLSRGSEVAMLKHYIIAEAKDKCDLEIDRGELQGVTAKGLPQQSNYCDCGVYLIAYLETFARDPSTFVSRLLRREKVEDISADFNASSKRTDIRNELLALHDEQVGIRKPSPHPVDDISELKKSSPQTSEKQISVLEESAVEPANAQHQTPKHADEKSSEAAPQEMDSVEKQPTESAQEVESQEIEQVPPRPLYDDFHETELVESSGDELAVLAQKPRSFRNDLLSLQGKPVRAHSDKPDVSNSLDLKSTRKRQKTPQPEVGDLLGHADERTVPEVQDSQEPVKLISDIVTPRIVKGATSSNTHAQREAPILPSRRPLQSTKERLLERSHERNYRHSPDTSQGLKRNGPLRSASRPEDAQTIEID